MPEHTSGHRANRPDPTDGPGRSEGPGRSDRPHRSDTSSGPLAGRSVVLTRAREQSADLIEQLEALGSAVVLAPAIEIVEASDGGAALKRAVASLAVGPAAGPDWIVFTSANAVRSFCGELATLTATDPPASGRLGRTRIAVVGSATRDAVVRAGLEVDLLPDRFVAEGLLERFPSPPQGGGRVLLPRAEAAREVLPEGLRRMGWAVEVVPAYRTVPANLGEALRAEVAGADAVCFASASAVTAFVDAYRDDVPRVIAAIGPVTAAAVTELGLSVAVQPEDYTASAMVAALAGYFGAAPGAG